MLRLPGLVSETAQSGTYREVPNRGCKFRSSVDVFFLGRNSRTCSLVLYNGFAKNKDNMLKVLVIELSCSIYNILGSKALNYHSSKELSYHLQQNFRKFHHHINIAQKSRSVSNICTRLDN